MQQKRVATTLQAHAHVTRPSVVSHMIFHGLAEILFQLGDPLSAAYLFENGDDSVFERALREQKRVAEGTLGRLCGARPWGIVSRVESSRVTFPDIY